MQLENVSDIYPLTPVQQGILYHCLADEDAGHYVDQLVLDVAGEPHLADLQAAWSDVVQRHDTLRTAFLWEGLDQPLQVVRQQATPGWRQLNWLNVPETEQDTRLQQLIRDNHQRGFDLARPPLFYVTLIRRDARLWTWVICFHHLILDGWSMHQLIHEVQLAYQTRRTDQAFDLPRPLAFRDFIQWQKAQDHESALDQWRLRLAGFHAPNRLTIQSWQSGKPARPGTRRQIETRLNQGGTRDLEQLARQHRLTLNTLVQGAWAIVVSHYSNQGDVVFGTTVSGRNAPLPGMENAVGMFINTLPMRVDADARQPVVEWLTELQRQQMAASQLDFCSLAAIQRVADVSAGESLFESIVVFENYPEAVAEDEDTETGGLRIVDRRHIEQSHYPLALIVVPGEELRLILIFDPASLPSPRAHGLLQHTQQVLRQIAAVPEQPVNEWSLLTAADKACLREWNQREIRPAPTGTIPGMIERQARSHPDRVAVVGGDQSLTYRELDQQANRLARHLLDRHLQPGERVGLLAEPAAGTIVGILGILKAGGSYVPLDPDYPAAHRNRCIEDAAIRFLVSRRDVPDTTCHCLQPDCVDPAADAPPVEIGDDQPAYVIYTSGSSGQPKGVVVTHANLLFSTLARHRYYGHSVGSFLLLSSFSFDSSVAGIFWTLTSGGRLVLCEPQLKQDVQRLCDLVQRETVTHTLCLPSLYRLILEFGDMQKLDSLSSVIVAGEACDVEVVQRHFARRAGKRLFNEYGPTEATVWCTVHEFSPLDAERPISIGRPVPDARIYILDRRGLPSPIGVTGELCVGGPGISRGYLNLPEATARQFVEADYGFGAERIYRTGDLACYDEHGQLFFAGRRDDQVKIRGHRIEVQGIADILRQVSGVREAVVTARETPGREGGPVNTRLIACFTREDGVDDSSLIAGIRARLQQQLPAFAIPDALVPVDTFPRLANGKINYRDLPTGEPGDRQPGAGQSPQNDMQECLAEIWKQSLGREEVGIHEDFFALGGDSIISIQVVSRARQAGIYLEPGDLARYPTVAGLSARARWMRESPAEVASTHTEDREFPLTPIQHWFFEQKFACPHHWNQSQLFEIDADVDNEVLQASLDLCARRHEMLRARFVESDRGWRQSVAPAADRSVPLEMLSVAGSRLEAECFRVQSELALDTGPLWRAARFQMAGPMTGQVAGNGQDRLLIAVHHLVTDAVSWQILVRDLNICLQSLAVGQHPDLIQATASYRQHAESLVRQAGSESRQQEIPYWTRLQNVSLPPQLQVPASVSADVITEGAAQTHRIRMDATTTTALHTGAGLSLRARPVELMLTALVMAVARWTGRPECYLELESHGRLDADDQADYSNTTGWFTVSFPVLLELPGQTQPAACLKAIKEQLRAVPAAGTGFGILRYLADARTRRLLAGIPVPQILFNYLGRFPQADPEWSLRPLPGGASTSRHPDNRRPHLLEINAVIQTGELVLDWIYNGDVHNPGSIAELSADFSGHLTALVDLAQHAAGEGLAASDFPDSGLNQEQLDQFLDEFD
jgi:amino acid adenylation domain-containing protein/non-ribosomal peptide synthase protein (TIGR01720 family)